MKRTSAKINERTKRYDITTTAAAEETNETGDDERVDDAAND